MVRIYMKKLEETGYIIENALEDPGHFLNGHRNVVFSGRKSTWKRLHSTNKN